VRRHSPFVRSFVRFFFFLVIAFDRFWSFEKKKPTTFLPTYKNMKCRSLVFSLIVNENERRLRSCPFDRENAHRIWWEKYSPAFFFHIFPWLDPTGEIIFVIWWKRANVPSFVVHTLIYRHSRRLTLFVSTVQCTHKWLNCLSFSSGGRRFVRVYYRE